MIVIGDRPLEELSLVELQVELEKSRETTSLQLREHAEEIENVCFIIIIIITLLGGDY